MSSMQIESAIRRDFESAGGIDALTDDILFLSADVNPEDHSEPGVDDPSIDCRLRHHDGSFQFLSGSSDYDQDHRGDWGAASVIADMSLEDARGIADDLLDQVIDSALSSV
jgi:hypothetical protein